MDSMKLKTKEAVQEVVDRARNKGRSYNEINNHMEWSISGYRQLMKRKTMNVETFVRLVNFLGYEVTIQPKREKGQRVDGQIVIMQDDEAKRDRPKDKGQEGKEK